MFKLAIVGRPNVGKSTLFNRLVGKRLALVDDQPGVTRDLREAEARLGDLQFVVIDTAGLEEADAESLPGRMRALTERAVDMADASLFLVDARAGLLPQDATFAEILRRKGARVLLGVNKAEGRQGADAAMEAWSLGFGQPIPLSAEHGEGMGDLYTALQTAMQEVEAERAAEAVDLPQDLGEEDDFDDELEEIEPGAPEKPIQIAVVGRPNAGKSTLINKILGEDRLLTGPEAGITRDAISVEIDWAGTRMRIFDTAGMRKKARIQEKLEKMSVSDGLRAVKFAEVVVVLVDADKPFETQDLRIADLAEREGRAVVVGVNKWDLVEDRQGALKLLTDEFHRLMPQLKGAPVVPVSALSGEGVERLRTAILKARGKWEMRISTAKLNQWLGEMTSSHPPPAPGGRRIKLRYMTQAKTRPPTFIAFCSRPEELPDSYKRFLVNGLRKHFGMEGTPIRLNWRKGENPYEGKRKKR
ncbi:ribosome biogenesis GTPase Der [Albimonas sp. CAU 1670]|uniref:ribosome biogenesis GTPase Der n=1 Tax=Albimonas sp. CAU 1670 TaxID=3032599 RepID=UPI0023D9CD28|nr:ribosome biogenesis GTPase Der [Albimonas sp. CAU 1670]MDF2232018.1 ribosome biogenesis GTPase Der [Albimonas sp. CAU 1670]